MYPVRLRITYELFRKLSVYLEGTIKYSISEDKPAGEHGWCEVNIQYDNFFKARESILNFGRAAEVLEPEALRASVIDYAKQILDFYQEIKVTV